MRYLLLFLAALLVGWLIAGWSLMLTIGIAHRDWWHFIPVLGYHAALAITFPGLVLGCIAAVLAGAAKEALK